MDDTVLVNLHCHTIFSDGELTPEALAANLAAAGVRYAALTDHNSLIGLPRFQDTLQKRGVAYLPGVEVTTWFHGREAHLLAYGFDTQHADLDATLFSLRQTRNLEVHSIASSLRKMGVNRPGGADDPPGISAAPDGWWDISEAIDLLHSAGGQVFWAHPLVYESDPVRLDVCVAELKALGLDGLEALYAPFAESRARRVVSTGNKARPADQRRDRFSCRQRRSRAGLGDRNAPRGLGQVSGGGLRRGRRSRRLRRSRT